MIGIDELSVEHERSRASGSVIEDDIKCSRLEVDRAVGVPVSERRAVLNDAYRYGLSAPSLDPIAGEIEEGTRLTRQRQTEQHGRSRQRAM